MIHEYRTVNQVMSTKLTERGKRKTEKKEKKRKKERGERVRWRVGEGAPAQVP